MNNASSLNNYFLPGMPLNNNLSAGTAMPATGNPLQMLQQDAIIISNLISGLESLESQIMGYISNQMPQTNYMPPVGLPGTYQYPQSMPTGDPTGISPYPQSMPTGDTSGISSYPQSMPTGDPTGISPYPQSMPTGDPTGISSYPQSMPTGDPAGGVPYPQSMPYGCPPFGSDPNNPVADPNNPNMSGFGCIPAPPSLPTSPPSGGVPNPQDGVDALVQALNNQDTQTVTQLIQQGVDVTATDPQSGKTLLSIAAASGNADDVKALVNAVPKEQQKDYVNQQDAQSGQTALFDAGKSNNKDVVDALIDAGADTNIKDNSGTNVYDYVKSNVSDVNADLLKDLSPTVTVDGANGVKIATADMSDDEINTVKDYVKFMSQDADGAKLLQAASQDGDVTISYEPSFKDGMGGDTAGHHIRLSKKVIDNEAKAKNDPTDIMGLGAMAHEFVHAATESDGDSKQEESLATTIGTRIAGRYYNQPVDEQKIYDDWINGQTNNDAYKDMQVDNGIFTDVSNLGVDVSNIHEHDPVKS